MAGARCPAPFLTRARLRGDAVRRQPAGGLVVVGGSAGSHPALLRMVAALPADLVVLVVIHVGAQARSRLPQILRRESQLPASHAMDGAPLRNGEILVAPPDFHLVLDDSQVRLSSGPQVNRVRPAVDVLFETAARSAGPLVTAVVLSGVLDDGAVSAAHVSRAGGQVLVEAPDQAPHSSMPTATLAAPPGAMAVPATALAAAVDRTVRRAAERGLEVHDVQGGSAVIRMAERSDPGFLAEGETRLTRLACPECGGGMAEVSLPSISYFHCHVGHQYGPQALAAAQAEASEAKLWSAVAALEEQAFVLRHLAEHQPAHPSAYQRDDSRPTAGYARHAQQITELADAFRAYLRRNQDNSERDVPIGRQVVVRVRETRDRSG